MNPNNPTGNVAKPSTIMEVLSIAKDWPNCTIIADEIYDALDFSGDQRSVASLSDEVPVVTLNGVSKVHFAPGWRIGYMAFFDQGHFELHEMAPREPQESCASTHSIWLFGWAEPRSPLLKERLRTIERRVDCV